MLVYFLNVIWNILPTAIYRPMSVLIFLPPVCHWVPSSASPCFSTMFCLPTGPETWSQAITDWSIRTAMTIIKALLCSVSAKRWRTETELILSCACSWVGHNRIAGAGRSGLCLFHIIMWTWEYSTGQCLLGSQLRLYIKMLCTIARVSKDTKLFTAGKSKLTRLLGTAMWQNQTNLKF